MKRQHFFLVNHFLQNEIISREEVEIYQFGIECFVLKTVHYLSYIIIAVLMEMPFELLVMGGILIPLRRNAGGYHVKTKVGCYIFSCVIVMLALSICKILSTHYVWYVMLFFANLLLIFLTPVDNENKTMDFAEIHYFRKKAMKILLITNIICFLGVIVENERLYAPIIMGICVAAFMVLLGKYTNKSVRRFKTN